MQPCRTEEAILACGIDARDFSNAPRNVRDARRVAVRVRRLGVDDVHERARDALELTAGDDADVIEWLGIDDIRSSAPKSVAIRAALLEQPASFSIIA